MIDDRRFRRDMRRLDRLERRQARLAAAQQARSLAGQGAVGGFAGRLRMLFKTTAFRILVANLVVFLIFAFMLVGWMTFTSQRILTEQITETVDAELTGLAEQYRSGGIRRLVAIVDGRSRAPGSALYLVTTPTGMTVAGNIEQLPTGTLDRERWLETNYTRLHGDFDAFIGDHRASRALVRVTILPGGFRMVVGHDLRERDRIRSVFSRGARAAIAVALVLGILGAAFVTRRVLRRVDAMTETATNIMAGDLTERLPIAGSGDELDRLALSVNAMLNRIEALMVGLKEVSDNIAHDLRTPLTRLRNRADEALRRAASEEEHKAALEKIIEESDNLIGIFNALLLIARVETGSATVELRDTDLKPIVEGLAELYEPVAEEVGLVLRATIPQSVVVRGHRELLTQALSNLIDNALKYGKTDAQSGEVLLQLEADTLEARVTVADHGPGIPEADRERVFERFVRLEQSRSRPGSGLGLSLADAVLRLHGGSITLSDNQPGLRAVIHLPLAQKGSALG